MGYRRCKVSQALLEPKDIRDQQVLRVIVKDLLVLQEVWAPRAPRGSAALPALQGPQDYPVLRAAVELWVIKGCRGNQGCPDCLVPPGPLAPQELRGRPELPVAGVSPGLPEYLEVAYRRRQRGLRDQPALQDILGHKEVPDPQGLTERRDP